MPPFQAAQPFQGLHRALLWLRLEANRKQGEVAKAAGLTPAMVCAFEKGKRLPSIPSLGKILAALQADEHDLARALDAVNRRGSPPAKRAASSEGREKPPPTGQGLEADLGTVLEDLSVSLRRAVDTLGTLSEKHSRGT